MREGGSYMSYMSYRSYSLVFLSVTRIRDSAVSSFISHHSSLKKNARKRFFCRRFRRISLLGAVGDQLYGVMLPGPPLASHSNSGEAYQYSEQLLCLPPPMWT